jgi:hypothetical protein
MLELLSSSIQQELKSNFFNFLLILVKIKSKINPHPSPLILGLNEKLISEIFE